MIKLGITGGIGSGKSTVSEIIKLLDVPVYIADIESKKITESSPVIRKKLIEAFGEDLYDGEKLNKPLLASYIFNDKQKLTITNSIIHPKVDKDFCRWVEDQNSMPVVAVETAILFESGMNRFTNKVLMVYTPLEERIRRTMLRDKTSRQKVEERISSQMPDEKKAEMADYIIYNDEKKSLIQQCIDLINILRSQTV